MVSSALIPRVRRRRLGDASREGFEAFLEHTGRDVFDRFRGGVDMVAGRLAHDERTTNELTDWA